MIQLIKNITILFFLLLSLSVSACSKDDFTPAYPKSEGVTRLVSYNVGVFAKYAKSGYKMTARMMKELDADAVCMQELDSCTTRTKHVFQVKRFAELMGWEYVYAKAMPYQGGYYGTGLACKDKNSEKIFHRSTTRRRTSYRSRSRARRLHYSLYSPRFAKRDTIGRGRSHQQNFYRII